jgi:LemA protein
MRPFDGIIPSRLFLQVGGVIAIAIILAVFLLSYNATYTVVVTLDRQADGRWAEITHDLVERYREIPSLVAVLGPSLGPDTPALDQVTENLSRWNVALRDGGIGRLDPETVNLEAALGHLDRVLERHPDLLWSLEVLRFREGLDRSGAAIEADRAAYNEAVRRYNEAIGSFPATLWSENWGFVPRDFFTAELWERDAPPLPPA